MIVIEWIFVAFKIQRKERVRMRLFFGQNSVSYGIGNEKKDS